jgi:hypothetical protein
VIDAAGNSGDGVRLRALTVWRAGLKIGETLDLAETDLDASRGASGLSWQGWPASGSRDGRWAWSQLEPWLAVWRQLAAGALFCVIRGDRRSAMGIVVGSQAAGDRSERARAATVGRISSARARRRDGARGRSAGRHPAPTSDTQPRRHLHVAAGERQLRDHPHRQLATSPR